MSATPTITRRKLTNAEVFNLTTWYKESQDHLQSMTDGEICAEAEKELKITGLNESHLQGVRKTLGIQKRPRRPLGGG